MAPLNLTRLEELFEEEGDNPETIDYWYQQLSEYEPEGNESSESIDLILKAMKWIMQYEHANAEELKELAEKEAAELVEKQENWEEERENMKSELNALRGRITSAANATDLNEAFRAQISSLQEENAYLKAQNRERDRELADRSDKAEKLTSRIEQLEKERSVLIQQQTFSDDAIRELNRRLDSKSEASANSEADAAKLRQRNQQAAQLSKQLQEVVHQNDELRVEVEQLSAALTSATAFIEETAENYTALRQQLIESDKIIERLTNDNELLTKKLEDERAAAVDRIENADENSTHYYKEQMQLKDEQIEVLQQKFETLQIELQELQAQSMLQQNFEREEEMERLRKELVEATKTARQLFSTAVSRPADDSISQMQNKILELNETIDALQSQIKQNEVQIIELSHNLEVKDAENLKVNAELKKLRVTMFGSAEVEISRLEKQLSFREQQIEKLTAKCSLLQIELATTVVNNRKLSESDHLAKTVQETTTNELTMTKRTKDNDDNEGDKMKSAKIEEEFIQENEEEKDESVAKNVGQKIQKTIKHSEIKKKRDDEESLESWEASAMIISSLNHELMLLMQEIDQKDRQLRRMEETTTQAISSIDKLKVRYFNLQKEVSEYDGKQINKNMEELQEKIENYEIRIEEYQKLTDSIRLNGSDVERKLEEMNRQVVAERLRNLQLVRKVQTVERNRNEQNDEFMKLEKSYREQKLMHVKQLKIANYESDLAAIEIARLQTVLLNSVPRKEYDLLLAQHKHLLASDGNYKIHQFETDEHNQEYIGVNLLKEMADETKSAELAAENAHLKGMINVLTSQTEYWQTELEKIRAQNTEMREFLEDIESESQMKSLLVALERRFLKALTERAQISQNQTFANQQLIDVQNEFTKKRKVWANEKKKLIQIIQSLQLLLQQQGANSNQRNSDLICQLHRQIRNRLKLQLIKRTRANSMDLITVQQMLQYKEKIAEINANYEASEKYKEEIEREKEELDLQLRNAEALRKSYEQLQENDYNVIKLQKSLQANQLNLLNTTKQLENAQMQIQKKEAQIQKLEDTVCSLKKEIEDLFLATFKTADFDENIKKTDEQMSSLLEIAKMENEEQTKLNRIEQKPGSDNNIIKMKMKMEADTAANSESETEAKFSTITESSAIGTTQNTAIIIEEYEKKLKYIRETAELCVENYKRQLKYKEEVIEKYKGLLKSVQQKTVSARIDEFSTNAEDSEKRKLRTSSEILSQINDTENEAKDLEILKLRNEIEQFIIVNRKLTDEMGELEKKDKKNYSEVGIQTENEAKMDEIQETVIPEISSAKREECKEAVVDSESTRIQTPPPRSTRTIPFELTDMQDDMLAEALRKKESTTMLMRMEIRKLKQHIGRLNARNQELEKACETIRAEALSQIERSYAAPLNNEQSETVIAKLQNELSALKTEVLNQKNVIREQKEVIGQMNNVQKNQSAKNNQVEVAKWHEKKAREGHVESLRKKLKIMEEREQEVREKLEKRERRIEQLNRSENARCAELERLQTTLRKLKEDKEMSTLQEKVAIDRLKVAEETNTYLNQRIAQLKKENNQLLVESNKQRASFKQTGRNINKLSTTKVSTIVVQKVPEEMLGLKEKAEQFEHLMERFLKLEKEVEEYREEIRKLTDKLSERRYDCGAVAVLRDKLLAKEKVIEQQQQRIEQLEKEKWQNLL